MVPTALYFRWSRGYDDPRRGGGVDDGSMWDPIESEALALDPRRARFSARMKVATAGACALVLALVLVLTLPQSSSSAGAAAAVRSALDNTLTSPAMSFTSTEQIGISSATISTSGSGTCDLQSGSCEVTMNYSGAESSFGPETGRYIGNVLYYEMGPAIRSELPTPWISLDLGNLRSLEGGSPESPLAGLSYLAQTGSVVTDNGTTTMNGAPVTQYSVTYSASSIQKIVTEVARSCPRGSRALSRRSRTGRSVKRLTLTPRADSPT